MRKGGKSKILNILMKNTTFHNVVGLNYMSNQMFTKICKTECYCSHVQSLEAARSYSLFFYKNRV